MWWDWDREGLSLMMFIEPIGFINIRENQSNAASRRFWHLEEKPSACHSPIMSGHPSESEGEGGRARPAREMFSEWKGLALLLQGSQNLILIQRMTWLKLPKFIVYAAILIVLLFMMGHMSFELPCKGRQMTGWTDSLPSAALDTLSWKMDLLSAGRACGYFLCGIALVERWNRLSNGFYAMDQKNSQRSVMEMIFILMSGKWFSLQQEMSWRRPRIVGSFFSVIYQAALSRLHLSGTLIRVQGSARVNAPGCVNASGKLGRSDKLQQ